MRRLVKRSIAKYEYEIASDKRNPKRLFKYISSRQKLNNSINCLADGNGILTTNPERMAHLLNTIQLSFYR